MREECAVLPREGHATRALEAPEVSLRERRREEVVVGVGAEDLVLWVEGVEEGEGGSDAVEPLDQLRIEAHGRSHATCRGPRHGPHMACSGVAADRRAARAWLLA